jgi:hypothetical protein
MKRIKLCDVERLEVTSAFIDGVLAHGNTDVTLSTRTKITLGCALILSLLENKVENPIDKPKCRGVKGFIK